MSRILSKKMNKTPARSPSPDLAHRNVIVRTASPLSGALEKLRMSKTSTGPLGRGFSTNEQFEAYINSLQEQLKKFSIENSILQHDIENKTKEIEFLKEMNFNYRKKEACSRSQSRTSSQPNILNEYEAKLGQMSQQVKRVHEILVKDRSTISRLQKQNEDLRNRNARSSRVAMDEESRLKQELFELEKKWNYQFNRRLAPYQDKVELVLQEQVKKLSKIEKEQKLLAKGLQKKNAESPIRHQRDKEAFSLSTYHTPPSNESKNISGDLTRSRQIECPNCKAYLTKIAQLQAELSVKNFYHTTASKSSKDNRTVPASQLEEYLQKLEEIKMILNNQEIEESINHIETNLNEIFSIQEKFQFMKQQKNSIIQALRDKQVEQSLEIVKLKKQNELFKNQIQQQVEEIEQLKDLVQQSSKTVRKDDTATKRKRQTSESNILRKYIVQAIERIQSLQSQIGDTLRS